MVRHLAAAAALAVLLSAPARAEDEKPRIPVNPAASAKPGDWASYEGHFKNATLHEAETKLSSAFQVEGVSGDEVTIKETQHFGREGSSRDFKLSKSQAPTLDDFFGLEGAKVSDVSLSDATHKLGGKEVACKKLAFKWVNGTTGFACEALFAAEVHASALVAFSWKGEDGSELELHVTGSGDKAHAAAAEASFTDGKLACPVCGKTPENEGAEKCPHDGAVLVRADLVTLHNIIVEIAKAPIMPYGLPNPFAEIVKDDDVDVAALEKLVAAYKAARKHAKFKPLGAAASPREALGAARMHAQEAAAIGALKTIATSEAIFREGDKDQNGELDYGDLKALGDTKLIDSVLASGKKQGYLFECHPSTDKEKKCFCWWATATPIEPGKTGERYFFTNQQGVIWYSKKPIKIDDKIKESCDVPEGLTPVGK